MADKHFAPRLLRPARAGTGAMGPRLLVIASATARSFAPIAALVLLLGAWELSSGTLVNPYFVSSPSAIWDQLIAWVRDGYLVGHLVSTLSGVGLSFVIASVAGIGFALVLGSSPTVDRILYPFVVGAFTIPKVALGPLFIVWFGIGFAPVVALGVLTAFFMVFFNAYSGIRNTSQALLDVSRLMGAGPVQRALKFRLPAGAPLVFEGLRVGAIFGFHGVVVGEIIASSQGLGYVIIYSAQRANPAGVFAGLVVLGVLATVFVTAVNSVQRMIPG